MRELLLLKILIASAAQIKLNHQYNNEVGKFQPLTIFGNCTIKLLSCCTKSVLYTFPDELTEVARFFNNYKSLTPTIGLDVFVTDETGSFENRNSTVLFPVTTRFTKCYVHCHLQGWVDFLKPQINNGTNILWLFPYYTHLQRENPDYVAVLTSQSTETNFIYLKENPTWSYYFLVSHAKIIYIRNGTLSQLLCISCIHDVANLQQDQIFLNITNLDLDRINEVARHVHSNLLKAPVAQTVLLPPDGCSPAIVSRMIAGSCAQDMLGLKLNFTSSLMSLNAIERGEFRKSEPLHSSAVVFGFLIDTILAERIANYSYDKGILFEYVVAAEIFSSFTFLLIISEPSLMSSGLWDGMDRATWGLIACSTVAAILALKFARDQNLRTTNASEVVLFFLLEQGQLPFKNSLQSVGKKGALIVAIWALVSIVICNGFKGNMFSLLTSISLPKIPEDWEEIVKSGWFLVSPASFYFSSQQHSKLSLIHQTIKELQAEGKLSRRLDQTLSELSHKLVFTNATNSMIAYSQTSRGKEIDLPSPSQPFRLPDDYIFIHQDRHLGMYSLLMKVAKNKSLILQGPRLDAFLERMPVLIVRNFLTENYSKKLFQIVESGLWSMWEKYSNMYNKLVEIKQFIALGRKVKPEFQSNDTIPTQELVGKLKSRYNLLALIWGDAKTTGGMTSLVGLHLKTFKVVFSCYGLGILTSLVRFLHELYRCRAWERWRFISN